MTRRRTPRTSVIRLTTGNAARTLNHPFARREPVLDDGVVQSQPTLPRPAHETENALSRRHRQPKRRGHAAEAPFGEP